MTLEQLIGVMLLDRTRQQVRLTRAGTLLLKEAREILAHSAFARSVARQAGSEHGRLRVGYVTSTSFGLLPAAMRLARARYPEMTFHLEEHQPETAFEALETDLLDLALVHEPPPIRGRIELSPLLSAPLQAVLPADWPLATRSSVSLTDLSELPVILGRDQRSDYRALITAWSSKANFIPNVVQEENDPLALLTLVAGGVGYTFAHRLVQRIGMRGIVFLPIDGLPEPLHITLSTAVLRGISRPPVDALIDALRTVAPQWAAGES